MLARDHNGEFPWNTYGCFLLQIRGYFGRNDSCGADRGAHARTGELSCVLNSSLRQRSRCWPLGQPPQRRCLEPLATARFRSPGRSRPFSRRTQTLQLDSEPLHPGLPLTESDKGVFGVSLAAAVDQKGVWSRYLEP